MSWRIADLVLFQGLRMYEQNVWSILKTLRLCLDLVAEEHWHMDNLLPFGGLSPHKIRVFHPQSFEEAQKAILAMKADDMLLVNLATVESKLAQRLTDYLAGSTFALSGERMEVGKGVFLFAPSSFSVRKIVASAC